MPVHMHPPEDRRFGTGIASAAALLGALAEALFDAD